MQSDIDAKPVPPQALLTLEAMVAIMREREGEARAWAAGQPNATTSAIPIVRNYHPELARPEYVDISASSLPWEDRNRLAQYLQAQYAIAVTAAWQPSSDIAAVKAGWGTVIEGVRAEVCQIKAREWERTRGWREQENQRLATERQHQLQAYAVQQMGTVNASKRLEQFRPETPENAAALGLVKQWIDDDDIRKGCPFMLLLGQPGTGKTHLLCGSYWAMAERGGLSVTYHNEQQLYQRWLGLPAFSRDGEDTYTRGDLQNDLMSVGVLILDDLGKQKMTEGWASAIYGAINWRLSNGMPTLFASNWTPNQLQERGWEESLADRINDALIVPLNGASWRGKA